MLTLDQLLAPIAPGAPCGEDLSFAPEMDAIARAREADDPTLEQGAWVTAVKEADWKLVAKESARLLATRSKDLKLAVWLAEARAKTQGLRGLGESLQLLAGLCERFWDGLYPLPDDGDHELRTGKLRWLANAMPHWLRALPLTEGAGYSLIDIEMARSRAADGEGPDVEGARRRSAPAFYRAMLDDAAFCKACLAEAEQAIDAALGDDAPGFTAAKAALDDVTHALTISAQDTGAVTEAVMEAAAETPMPVAKGAGQMGSRAQALAQLREVAAFFRRTEPHSPVAYLAEKAAQWGEQPLHVWLRSVVKDASVSSQLDELLGVQDK